MITTSFFSKSVCNSAALMRRALSAGVDGGSFGVGEVLGVCESTLSFELHATNPPTVIMNAIDTK
jgi:hypothetical protein